MVIFKKFVWKKCGEKRGGENNSIKIFPDYGLTLVYFDIIG
jgi:hypothetical protein